MLDVLVVGSGGAGLCAALLAKEQNKKVLIVSKTYSTHSQSVQAQGGINAVLDENEESILLHINDTKKSAHKLGSNLVIKTACKNAKESIDYLDKLGVPFSRDEKGNIKQRMFGASSQSRTCYSSDYTGLKILHTLYDETLKQDIPYLNEHMLLNIIIKNKKAIGITVLDIEKTIIKEIFAKTIILATGGYCNLYNKYTTNSNQTTGDAHIAALNAGAELSNMEYIQFHPTAMKDNNILISESARAEGGYLLDKNKKRFVDELQARDIVSRAINEKTKNNEEVYLDLRHLGLEKIKELLPQERTLAYNFLGIKIEEELISINPAAHYSMGGIKTNIKGHTNVQNLFAVGECAQNGLHGANRIGGNSLLELITFGRIVGKEASIRSLDVKYSTKDENSLVFIEDKKYIENIFLRKNELNFYKSKTFLGKLFFENFGLVKNEKDMKKAQKEINIITKNMNLMGIDDKQRVYNKNLQEFLEFKNLLDLAFIVSTSSLNRCESRGAHYREDYKKVDDSFEKNSICTLKNEKLLFYFEDII